MRDFIRNRWGYIVCAAGFFICCGILSPINSYGRLFTAIQTDLNTTTVQSGWIGSISWANSFFFSPLAVAIERCIGHRMTVVLGCTLASCCYLVTSFMTTYIGVLAFLGIICGTALCFSLHAMMCVLFKAFADSGQSRAMSIALVGSSVGTIFLSLTYEKIVPIIGWRQTLQISSAFSAILSIPASFLVTARNETSTKSTETTTAVIDEKQENQKREDSPISSISDKVDRNIVDQSAVDTTLVRDKHWLRLIVLWRAWFIFFAMSFPAMSWSVYWVNSISYFESISASADDILVYVIIMTVSDFLAKFSVIIVPRGTLNEVNVLILSDVVGVFITLLFVLWPVKPVLIVCCVYIGIGRALYNILPFKATVDLLDVANPEQGITLGMFALGVGFAVGTVPAGAIYDISGSYSVAFIINSVFFSIGGGFLMMLKSCKPRWRRRRESRHSVHKSQTSCQSTHGRRTSSDSHGVDNQIEIKG